MAGGCSIRVPLPDKHCGAPRIGALSFACATVRDEEQGPNRCRDRSPIARVAGAEIRIHFTFLFLLAWFGISAYSQGGIAAAIDILALMLAVFLCVVLHELGHALAAGATASRHAT